MMRDPFRIEGPALISFSGGRTSGYMLRRVLDAHGGKLPLDVHAVFANTGKERPETLDFVQTCSTQWGVPVTWVEYRVVNGKARHVEVEYASASRNGEPFTALCNKNAQQHGKAYLPNAVQRICTSEMKIRTMKRWMLAQGHRSWTNVVGIRADEPSRIHRQRTSKRKDRWDIALPLAEAGITRADVHAFWRTHSFDLKLRSWEGNCDLCFLKGVDKILRIMRERPDLGTWWVEREKASNAVFRKDRPNYLRLMQIAEQPGLPGFLDEDHGAIIDCMCSEDSGDEAESCGVVT